MVVLPLAAAALTTIVFAAMRVRQHALLRREVGRIRDQVAALRACKTVATDLSELTGPLLATLFDRPPDDLEHVATETRRRYPDTTVVLAGTPPRCGGGPDSDPLHVHLARTTSLQGQPPITVAITMHLLPDRTETLLTAHQDSQRNWTHPLTTGPIFNPRRR